MKDDFASRWKTLSPADRNKWASNCLAGLDGKAFHVCVDHAITVAKLNRARELASEASGSGPFLRAALIWFVASVVAVGIFLVNLPLWLRFCAAVTLIIVAGKAAKWFTLRNLRNTALVWPHVFREFWESGVIAIRIGNETYSNAIQATRWQDVLLLAVGHPQLCEVVPQSHSQMLKQSVPRP